MTLPLHSKKDLTARIMQEKIYSLLQQGKRPVSYTHLTLPTTERV